MTGAFVLVYIANVAVDEQEILDKTDTNSAQKVDELKKLIEVQKDELKAFDVRLVEELDKKVLVFFVFFFYLFFHCYCRFSINRPFSNKPAFPAFT